jgi:hypothetical protein
MATEERSTQKITRPRTDDRVLWDVLFGVWGYPAVFAAHQMKLFERLAEKPMTLDELARALNLATRGADALLALCASLGLVACKDGRYSLTPLSEDYLLPDSPTYWGWALDAWAAIYTTWTPDNVRRAAETDRPQGIFGDPEGPFAVWHADFALAATRAMHSLSIPAALAWPHHLDLSRHKVMLDVGGGSGAHSIGAANAWPGLRFVVLDREPICAIARQFAEQHGLEDRISFHTADFFADPFPEADVHFYSMIFHDWPPEKCRFLAHKSFASLPSGGRIIIHEMLFNDDRTGPFPVAAFNVDMLVAMPGQQYSGRELLTMLQGPASGRRRSYPPSATGASSRACGHRAGESGSTDLAGCPGNRAGNAAPCAGEFDRQGRDRRGPGPLGPWVRNFSCRRAGRA